MADSIYQGAAWMDAAKKGRNRSATQSAFGSALNSMGQNFGNMSPEMQGQVAGGIAGGVAGILGGIVGGRARRQEQKAAKAELAQRQQAYESFQFTNPYANMENAFEDVTVNQQQAQFEAQQQQQALASTMSGMQQAAGSSGIAALAQAMAQQQSANIQRAGASIGAQEAAIQSAKAQEAGRIQTLQAQGAAAQQAQRFERTETLLGMSQQRKAQADEARRQATQSLIGGIGEIAGSVIPIVGQASKFGNIADAIVSGASGQQV